MITVLLPLRNAGVTLDAALDSLWRQSWGDFRVIAIDDHSTDDTGDRLHTHARRETRLTVVANEGRGIVDALETARRRADTPWLARFDGDDLCHPDRFHLQLTHVRSRPRAGAAGSRVVLFPRDAVGPGWSRYAAWLNSLLSPEDHARERFVESPLAHPSVLLRAEAVEAVGGYRDEGWAEDYDLWLRLVEAKWELTKVDRCLLGWRTGPDRLSTRSSRYTPDAFLAARAHYLARALESPRVQLWGAGRTGRRLARLLAEQNVLVTCFYEVDEKKIGRFYREIPIRSWESLESAGSLPLIVAVGAPGARNLIRPAVEQRGYREGIDVYFAG